MQTEQERSRCRLSGYWCSILAGAGVIVLLNLCAGFTGFCDFYTDRIFGLAADLYGRLTGLVPFSVGEVLIVAGILLTLAAVVMADVFLCAAVRRWVHKMTEPSGAGRAAGRYLRTYLAIVLVVAAVMTLNCSIPYNCTRMNVNGNQGKSYGAREITALRNYVVVRCNELAQRVSRDADGYAVYGGDMEKKVRESLEALGDRYPRYRSYTPRPKKLWGSFFMYQTNMIGIYFPFSMEANYNGYLDDLYYPYVACHELSHLKGYMYEDEADYMAYLATEESGDEFFQYSAYVNVLWFLEADFCDAVPEAERAQAPEISVKVQRDAHCYREDTLEELEGRRPLISTGQMARMGDAFTEGYLDYYGVEANYHEVTKLLLAHYDGTLY